MRLKGIGRWNRCMCVRIENSTCAIGLDNLETYVLTQENTENILKISRIPPEFLCKVPFMVVRAKVDGMLLISPN